MRPLLLTLPKQHLRQGNQPCVFQFYGARVKLQLFYKPLVSSVGSLRQTMVRYGGLEMCGNVRGLMIGAFPNAPKRRIVRGKKIKTPCRGVSKSFSELFVLGIFQVGPATPTGFGTKTGMVRFQVQFLITGIMINHSVGGQKKNACNQRYTGSF